MVQPERERHAAERSLVIPEAVPPRYRCLLGSLRFRTAVAVICALAAMRCAALDLNLETVKLPDGEFRFHNNHSSLVSELPFPVDSEGVQTGSSAHYTLYANLDDIRLSKYNYFHYRVYVRSKAPDSSSLIQFFFQGYAVGSFVDQLADVRFIVNAAGTEEPGTIRLPIFSFATRSFVECPRLVNPEEVPFAGEKLIPISLRNVLESLPVQLKRSSRAMPGNGKLWRAVELVGADRKVLADCELVAGATATHVVALRVRPHSTNAFANSFLPLARQPVHERISVALDYSTRGGAPRTITIEVPVRFKPSPSTLVLAPILGAFFGSLIPVFLIRSRTWAGWWRAFVAAGLLAILAEGIAMVLVANNSQFRLLGVELDPYQVMPAGLIGGLIGVLGFRGVDAFQKILEGGKR